jgi:hypothetical protein
MHDLGLSAANKPESAGTIRNTRRGKIAWPKTWAENQRSRSVADLEKLLKIGLSPFPVPSGRQEDLHVEKLYSPTSGEISDVFSKLMNINRFIGNLGFFLRFRIVGKLHTFAGSLRAGLNILL